MKTRAHHAWFATIAVAVCGWIVQARYPVACAAQAPSQNSAAQRPSPEPGI